MKKIAYLFSATAIVALAALSSCKKDKEETVDPSPDAPVVTSTMTTTNEGNSGTANASLDVTTSTGTAKIRLDVTSTVDLDRIYIMKSEDNGALVGQAVSDVVSAAGATFASGGASYSLKVPGSTKSFVIDIPVSVRTTSAAVTDVYYIWITNGSGDFFKPTKNTVLGAAKVTLKYTASASTVSFSTTTLNVGSQSAVNYSFLVTAGQVAVLSTADYQDAPESADIRFVTLTAATGKKNNTSASLYLYSPNDVTNANPSDDASAAFAAQAGSNTTAVAAYTGTDFATITGTQLQNLTVGSSTNVLIVSGGVYMFHTENGKQGLIKINSVTADTDATNAGGYNANITVKVLN